MKLPWSKEYIHYTIRDNQEFAEFRRASHESGLYPYNSDDIYNEYQRVAQSTYLLTGDYIELKWPRTAETDTWMMFMVLKGYDLRIKNS